MYFCVKLADLIIGINAVYPTSKSFLKEYLLEEKPQMYINITTENIEEERKVEDGEYSLQYLETLSILRNISNYLPKYNRFLCHGAVLSWHKKGFMFIAPSGTGKSTHVALWKKYLGENVRIINGDKPILFVKDNSEIRAYGTPWAGKEGWQENDSVILKGICVLQRARKNEICRLRTHEALPFLLQQIYYSTEYKNAGKTLEMLDIVLRNIPVYLLKCDISYEAFRCSFEKLSQI